MSYNMKQKMEVVHESGAVSYHLEHTIQVSSLPVGYTEQGSDPQRT